MNWRHTRIIITLPILQGFSLQTHSSIVETKLHIIWNFSRILCALYLLSSMLSLSTLLLENCSSCNLDITFSNVSSREQFTIVDPNSTLQKWENFDPPGSSNKTSSRSGLNEDKLHWYSTQNIYQYHTSYTLQLVALQPTEPSFMNDSILTMLLMSRKE